MTPTLASGAGRPYNVVPRRHPGFSGFPFPCPGGDGKASGTPSGTSAVPPSRSPPTWLPPSATPSPRPAPAKAIAPAVARPWTSAGTSAAASNPEGGWPGPVPRTSSCYRTQRLSKTIPAPRSGVPVAVTERPGAGRLPENSRPVAAAASTVPPAASSTPRPRPPRHRGRSWGRASAGCRGCPPRAARVSPPTG
jgi:hypothetical protein